MNGPVYKLSYLTLITDEVLVDGGIGTAEEQQAATLRLAARAAETERRWLALPLRVRLWRVIRYHIWALRHGSL